MAFLLLLAYFLNGALIIRPESFQSRSGCAGTDNPSLLGISISADFDVLLGCWIIQGRFFKNLVIPN